ncbi:MAG: methyltransferase domain-containing protein [Actinomycetota bacterium]|nr:methyltransferase domain-containing protein [Actinomycetota bacterium]
MRPSFADDLVCPLCGSSLELQSFDATAERVEEALLVCGPCSAWYPVVRGVPVLLDFGIKLHETFAKRHAGAIPEGLTPPQGSPRPGEASVQETFTEEWRTADESDLSFIYSAEDLVELNRRVWLPWLSDAQDVRTVLDAGCGLGAESVALREATGAQVVGVDSNLALLDGPYAQRPAAGVDYVVASIFALPFRPGWFDLVYSQGVLHHTYSTRAAFDAVARFVGERGYLSVWLYAREDRLASVGKRGAATRAAFALERALRPTVSRAPARLREAFFGGATRLAHPVLKPRMRHAERWERENTDAYLRDWLSPPFAHRHGWNEVIEWFEDAGFEIAGTQSPAAYRELFGAPLWGVGLTGRRVASAVR